MNGLPERGDVVETWLSACIQGFRAADDECSRITLEAMLEDYRLHADHQAPLMWTIDDEGNKL